MLTWASVIFFAFEVLNDSRSVLLLLKTKFSGDVLDDGRTETADHCLAPGWGGVWQDCGAAPDTCPACGKEFPVYGNSHRKFCSHACYIAYRFRGVRHG